MMADGPQTEQTAEPFERERGVYDVRFVRNLAYFVVVVGGGAERTTRIAEVFDALSQRGVPIFLVKLHRTAVSFAVEGSQVDEVESCLCGDRFPCTARRDLALISVVAVSMRDLIGVMVGIADALHDAGARIYGSGDSHNSVQCLIDGAHVDEAVVKLRQKFGLGDTHA